jgi:ABC-2 type transport system ATP-binding protein
MIETSEISKSFGNIKAVDNISLRIKEGTVFGMIGTNGAGKSTFMRMLAGVLRPDKGSVLVDGIPVYESEEAKQKFFYISDEQYFLLNATPKDMGAFYKNYYVQFDEKKYLDCLEKFSLDSRRKINTFSKGMKKQLSILLGICCGTKYILRDETFDGLDPVMRQGIKSMFAKEMEERGLTPIIASHNLRELEDICDHVGLLHKGGVLLSKDLEEMKCNIFKVQCVFQDSIMEYETVTKLDVLKNERRGSLVTLTIRGEREEIMNKIQSANPVFSEILPLSLEEIFISETEVVGYDIKKLIF